MELSTINQLAQASLLRFLSQILQPNVYTCLEGPLVGSLPRGFTWKSPKATEEKMSPKRIRSPLLLIPFLRLLTKFPTKALYAPVLKNRNLGSEKEVGRKLSPCGTWAAGAWPLRASIPATLPSRSQNLLRSSHRLGRKEAGTGRARRATRCDWPPGSPPLHPGASGGGGASRLLGSEAAGAY